MRSPSAALRHLYVPESRIFEVQILLSLPTEKIVQTADALRTTESLKNLTTDEQPFNRIASSAGLSFAQSVSVWSTVSNLSRQRTDQKINDGDFLDDLDRLRPEDAPALDQTRRRALLQLFARTKEGYLLEKANFLRTAYLPSLVSCRSVCDIRPLFDEKRERIEAAALVVMLGLETETEDQEMETIAIQATRAKLVELKKCISEAEQKLAVMERHFSGKVEFF
jgi:hypothetical protein